MSTILRLPNEILWNKIVLILSLHDKAILSAVCRSFNDSLIPHIYGNINITISRDAWDLSRVQSLARTVQEGSDSANYIERLKISTDFYMPYLNGYDGAVSENKRLYPDNNDLYQLVETMVHLPNAKVLNVCLPDPRDYSILQQTRSFPVASQLESLCLRYCEARDQVLEHLLSCTPNLKRLRYEIWRFIDETPTLTPYHSQPEFSMDRFGRAIGQVKNSLEWLDISMLIYMTWWCDIETKWHWKIDGHIPCLKDFAKLSHLECPMILLFGHQYYTHPDATLRRLLPANITHLCLRDDVCSIFDNAADWLCPKPEAFRGPRRDRPGDPSYIARDRQFWESEAKTPLFMRLLDLREKESFAPNLSKVSIKANHEHRPYYFDWGEEHIAQLLHDEGIQFELLKRPDYATEEEVHCALDFYSLRPEYEELA